jgi:hypothetical protein
VHYEHAKQVTQGDPAALWRRLELAYGTATSAAAKAAVRSQLNRTNRKIAKHTMDDYIAHTDKLIYELKHAGENVSNSDRKFWILEGLVGIPEWELQVELIRHQHMEDTMTADQLDQSLISADKARRLRQVNNHHAHDGAHFVQFNRGRSRGRGRGNWRGRGGGNFTLHGRFS